MTDTRSALRDDTRWEIYGETLPQAFEYLKGLYETQYRLNGLHYSEAKRLRAVNSELLIHLQSMIPLAQEGARLLAQNPSGHQQFISEDRDALNAARAALTKAKGE